jgi:hypothetical protein
MATTLNDSACASQDERASKKQRRPLRSLAILLLIVLLLSVRGIRMLAFGEKTIHFDFAVPVPVPLSSSSSSNNVELDLRPRNINIAIIGDSVTKNTCTSLMYYLATGNWVTPAWTHAEHNPAMFAWFGHPLHLTFGAQARAYNEFWSSIVNTTMKCATTESLVSRELDTMKKLTYSGAPRILQKYGRTRLTFVIKMP